MFRQLVQALGPNQNTADQVLTTWSPIELIDFLEAFWRHPRSALRNLGVGNNAQHSGLARRFRYLTAPGLEAQNVPEQNWGAVWWHHLAYAYMIENTRIWEIFRRVVREFVHGERLPFPSEETLRWARVLEELFLRAPVPFSVYSLASQVRPDPDATRRNAYFRLLGMDLNHEPEDGRTLPYIKAEAANREFAGTFEALLREVWLAYMNRNNQLNENRTDLEAIMTLVRRLREMLMARRVNGLISREEFAAVAAMSFVHLTVEYNTVVVRDLRANADGPVDRLNRIGAQVGLAPHARADSYFQMAESISAVLSNIETGAIENHPLTGQILYLDGEPLQVPMQTLITHWSIATGRNLKDPTARPQLAAVVAATQTVGAGNGVAGVNRLAGVLR